MRPGLTSISRTLLIWASPFLGGSASPEETEEGIPLVLTIFNIWHIKGPRASFPAGPDVGLEISQAPSVLSVRPEKGRKSVDDLISHTRPNGQLRSHTFVPQSQ